jgi:hypothetical protein
MKNSNTPPPAWDNFSKFSTLKIYFTDSQDSAKADIFANGLNQVGVTVLANAIDTSDNPLPLNTEDYAGIIQLVDYSTGAELGYGDTTTDDGVSYSDESNYYSNPLAYSSTLPTTTVTEDGDVLINFYVYSSKNITNKDIAVRVTPPGFDAVDSTASGGNPWHISLQALEAINYGDTSNLYIQDSEWSTLHSGIMWCVWNIDKYNYNNASTRWKQIQILPVTYNNYTMAFINSNNKFEYDGFLNESNICTDGADKEWIIPNSGNDSTSQMVACIDCRADDSNSYPHITCWGVNITNAEWGVDTYSKYESDKNRPCFTKGKWEYALDVEDTKQTLTTQLSNAEGCITLYCLDATVPADGGSDINQEHWADICKPVTVTVFDTYGNTGTIVITFGRDSFEPAITGQ